MKPKVWDTVYAVYTKGSSNRVWSGFDIKTYECKVKEVEGDKILLFNNNRKFVLDYVSFWFSKPYIMEQGERRDISLVPKDFRYDKEFFYYDRDDFVKKVRLDILEYKRVLENYYHDECPIDKYSPLPFRAAMSFEKFYWKSTMEQLEKFDKILSEINFNS